MNTHELPMILFTVIAQLSVGTFIALGIIDLMLALRHDNHTARRITEPVLYAIGPALVLGLIASMFHMNDPTHMLNVVRHWETSWLSREIIFGVAFAAFGFLFAIMQWFRIGSPMVRRIVALIAALLGIALVWSMAMIYQTISAVPAWHTPIVAFHFFMTTIILGALAVGCALMFTAVVRRRNEDRAVESEPAPEPEPAVEPEPGGGSVAVATKPTGTALATRIKEINAPTTEREWVLITRVVQVIAVVAAVAGVAVLISYPMHIADLAAGSAAAQASAAVFSGAFFVTRLILLGLAAVVLSLFAFRTAAQTLRERPQVLVTLITVAFVLAVVAEMMGRYLHYVSMLRVGI